MLCFLCSFAPGVYCYCRPGMPIRVESTTDMLLIDMSQCAAPTVPRPLPYPRRARSEPPICNGEREQFVRFRSLREGRRSQSRVRRPFVSEVSIASSYDKRGSQRKERRDRARMRIEAQLSTSSSSMSFVEVPAGIGRLELGQSVSSESAAAQDNQHDSSGHMGDPMAVPARPTSLDILNDDQIDRELERMHAALREEAKLPENPDLLGSLCDDSDAAVQPINWDAPINYSHDIQQYIHNYSNKFADPFEEEERRSRTEMWVESTSPGLPDSDEQEMVDALVDSDEMIVVQSQDLDDRAPLIPQVTVDECSENSLSSPRPTSPPRQPQPSIHVNGELLEDARRGHLDRIDSLQTEDHPASETSFVSSDMDKSSLVKLRYRDNLDKAREHNGDNVDIGDVDRFWHYRYSPDPKAAKEAEARELNRNRGHTPTVERVVMFYTSDKRPSLTPSVSSCHTIPTPSPEPSARSASLHLSAESALAVIRYRVPPSEEKLVLPVPASPTHRLSQSESLESKEEAELRMDENGEESPEDEGKEGEFGDGVENLEQKKEELEVKVSAEIRKPSYQSSNDELWNMNGVLGEKKEMIKESSRPASSLSSDFASIAVGHVGEDDFIEFVLDPTSESDQEAEGKVVIESASSRRLHGNAVSGSSRGRGQPIKRRRYSSVPSYLSRSYHGISRSYRRKMTPTVVMAQHHAHDDTSHAKHINERSLDELEHSSLEELLAMETRPSSSSRKSVSFSDYIDVEILSPQILRKTTPSPRCCSLAKPILKREDHNSETMRRVLRYAADRLYKDLRLLVEERDRAVHALEIVPVNCPDLSPHTAMYQMRYRDKLFENKCRLDGRIDEVWLKLRDLPLEATETAFVYGVAESCQLTTNGRRRILPRRHTQEFKVERKGRSELELASEYAKRLEKMRMKMVRRDSEILREDERSVEDILRRVRRALNTYDRI